MEAIEDWVYGRSYEYKKKGFIFLNYIQVINHTLC